MSFSENEMMLSILICSLPERLDQLAKLYEQLMPQTKNKPVEVIVISDNRTMTIGRKRQHLNELARGRYVVHVDDDDRVSDHYVDTLLNRIQTDNFDCINYVCMIQEDGNASKPCYYSKNFEHVNLPNYNLRKPNSRCCYKRDIALRHTFQDIAYAEDDDWGIRASNDIEKECIIDEVLYFYDFKTKPQNWFWTKRMRHENHQDEDDYDPNEFVTLKHDTQFQCCRKDPDAVLPVKAGKDEVGYDLTLISVHKYIDDDTVMFDTGLVVKPPPNYYLEILPRSSIVKKGWILANSVGVIDPTYRDTLKVVLKRIHHETPDITLPSKLCQLIVRRIHLPNTPFIEVESLDETERKGGFGSTDTKDNTSIEIG